MPLELRRVPAKELPERRLAVGPADNDLLTAYLHLFGRETGWLRKCVTVPLLGLDAGFAPERSLRIGVRAASIYLADHETSIILAVPEGRGFALTDDFTADLTRYIAQRYEGVAGGLFDVPFQRAAPHIFKSDTADSAPLQANMAMPSAAAPKPRRKAARAAAPPTLEELLARTDAGFSETLLKLIDRSGKKDAEIYKRANIDRKLFSKIRSNPAYKPSKSTALAFAIALELDLDETRDFIGRAGYALTHSSRFDIIVEYFILRRAYDVFALNEALFAFDQPLIGGV